MAKMRKPNDDHDEELMKKNIQKRFQSMFAGSGEPLTNMSIHEVEGLKSRIAELEARLSEQQEPGSNSESAPSTATRDVRYSAAISSRNSPSVQSMSAAMAALEKRVGLWVTGISAAMGLVFFCAALYIAWVIQQGEYGLPDKVLQPLTVLMVVANLAGFYLIRRNRPLPGLWASYLVSVILAPVLVVSVMENMYTLMGGYLAVFSIIFITLVLPKTSRLQALLIAVGAALIIAGIEIWHPGFRDSTNYIANVTPLITGPAALGILALFFIARQLRNPRIQARLTALIMIVMIPLLVGISSVVISLATTRIEQGAISELQGTSRSLASTVSTWLKLNTSALQELTLQPDILNMDAEQQRPVLEAMAESHPYMYLVSTTGLDGVNIARNDNEELTDYSDRSWFKAASMGSPVAYQILTGRTTGQPALVVSMPIKNPSGNIVGVGMFAADLTDLAKETQVSKLGERGFTFIVDANNQALAHPDATYTAELRDMSEYPPVVALRQGQTESITFTDENGERWHAYASPLDNGWAIIAQRPESEILAPARQFQFIVIALIVAGGGIMLAMAWYTIRRTLQPIATLTDTISAISAGDLNRVVEVKSDDEIGKLAYTFNVMTRQIRNLVEGLEQRVTDRTHDLELASEVGRIITENVANASEMLTTSAELIRSRFELYYTQVYLTDTSGQKLILRAGTGEVGEQLLSRGHQLVIDASSLNGQAVLGKKPVIVADTLHSPSFKPNSLLPKTRSEMAVPLIANDEVIGVLDMQSERPGALTENNLAAFQALAGQLAIAIQNANLFAEAEEARSEVEKQMRRFTEQGWQDFLNAIDRGQKLGFAFEKNEVSRLQPEEVSQNSNENKINIPITVTGTKIGEIRLPSESNRTWAPSEIELIQAASVQLAQHVENLRLLAQADQYRTEAEQAVRRLTQEGWSSYLRSGNPLGTGYVYDLNQVQPISTNGDHAEQSFKQPLVVGNEAVGELVLDLTEVSEETNEIISAVAEQLSGHIENLRLLEQTEQQRGQLSEALNIAKLANWEYDFDRDRFIFNDHFYSIFHTTAEQVGGYEVSSAQYAQLFVHPDDAALVGDEIGKAVASTERQYSTKLEHRILYADGGMGYISADVNIERDENGRITRWYGANQDITERKRAEEVIVAEQKRTRTILESVTVPMVITRLSDNHLTFVNAPALEVTKFNYDQVIDQPSPNFYADLEDRKKFITQLRTKGEVADMVVQLLRANGETFWALMSAKVFDYQAEPSILTTFMDITDRIRAQETVAKRATELATVAQVSTTASTVLDPNQLLQSAVDLTKERFGLYHAHIYLMNAEQNALVLTAGSGEVGNQMLAEGWSIAADHELSIVADAYRRRQSIVANDVHHDKESTFLSNRLLPDTRSEMALPLIAGDQVLGVFDVQSETVNYFTDDDVNIYTTLASQVAVALQNARFFEQVQSALAATQESETRLSEALTIAKLAHWEYDVYKDIFTFNDNFYAIFRTTAEQVGGYELSSADYAKFFVHPEDAALVGGEIGKALASTDQHYNVKLEHRILYTDGTVGYISADVHVERDETGKIIRWHGANQDITERKRAEDAIKAAQQRAQMILETVNVPMVISRLSDGVVLYANRALSEFRHVPLEELIGAHTTDYFVDQSGREKLREILQQQGYVNEFETQLKRRDGTVSSVLLSARVINYQDERAVLTTYVDITDKIRAQEAITKRATELATVAQVSTTASTVLDPDQLLQSVVDLTKERFGLYHVHVYLANETWDTLLLASGAGEVGRKLVAEQHAIPMSLEHSLVARAARERKAVIVNNVSAESGFLPNPLLPETSAEMAVPMLVGENILGVFDVQSNDISGFSDEDANIYITLASQVAVALQNARLYVEQAATLTQLRELDRLKSSFLANMSHELRTPLNSILGFTDVMMEGLDGPLTEFMDNDLRLIQKNGQHLLHLINDVLDMAKIEAGRMNLNPENFKAREVLEEVTNITSTLASEKNLALFIDADADRDIMIYADRTRLRQVMINLVNNSIKFTEQGQVVLNLAPMDGGRVLISVRDTGLGIPPEKLEAVFQEFTQVDSSTTRKTGGTGLGLPISRRLVEMHGGRLWADSTGVPGEGSIFFVELPLEARIAEVVERQEK